jgi:hypothetical protein
MTLDRRLCRLGVTRSAVRIGLIPLQPIALLGVREATFLGGPDTSPSAVTGWMDRETVSAGTIPVG